MDSIIKKQVLKCRFAVIKIASRCNLNCSYCYMYNMGDESYKMQPKIMSTETVRAMMKRINEHCIKHKLNKFNFVLHGGEPLLAGKEFFEKMVSIARNEISPSVKLNFAVQTNGVLLDKSWGILFERLEIGVGVSLDGPKQINDKNRVYHSGKGSYDDVIKGINAISQQKKPGLLSVLNTEVSPKEVFMLFSKLNVSSINFLFPDGNYNNPPNGYMPRGNETPYGDWLIEMFDVWQENKGDRISIGIFEVFIAMILGQEFPSDSFGTKNSEVLVIETNGDIESLDVLKICGDSFTKGDANVINTTFDEALETPLAQMYQLSHKNLPQKCKKCPISEICGGGYLPHRYSSENGFNNPSIFCFDLVKLITHIQNKVIGNLPSALVESSGIKPLMAKEIIDSIR